jgi:hypothetical protein
MLVRKTKNLLRIIKWMFSLFEIQCCCVFVFLLKMENINSTLLLVASLIASYIIVKIVRSTYYTKPSRHMAPSLQSLPLIGSLHTLPVLDEWPRYFLEKSQELGGVIGFYIGPQYALLFWLSHFLSLICFEIVELLSSFAAIEPPNVDRNSLSLSLSLARVTWSQRAVIFPQANNLSIFASFHVHYDSLWSCDGGGLGFKKTIDCVNCDFTIDHSNTQRNELPLSILICVNSWLVFFFLLKLCYRPNWFCVKASYILQVI